MASLSSRPRWLSYGCATRFLLTHLEHPLCDAQASQSSKPASKPWWSGLAQWLSVVLLLGVVAPVATHHVASTVVAATSDGGVAKKDATQVMQQKQQLRSQRAELTMPYSVFVELLREAAGTSGGMIAAVDFKSDKKVTATVNEESPLLAQLHAAADPTLNKFSVLLPSTAVHPHVSARDTHHRRVPADWFALARHHQASSSTSALTATSVGSLHSFSSSWSQQEHRSRRRRSPRRSRTGWCGRSSTLGRLSSTSYSFDG